MLELIQKIKDYTEAGIILEHMELFDEVNTSVCGNCIFYVNTQYHIGCPRIRLVNQSPSFGCNEFVREWL